MIPTRFHAFRGGRINIFDAFSPLASGTSESWSATKKYIRPYSQHGEFSSCELEEAPTWPMKTGLARCSERWWAAKLYRQYIPSASFTPPFPSVPQSCFLIRYVITPVPLPAHVLQPAIKIYGVYKNELCL